MEIITHPNPLLKQAAQPVTDFDEELQVLVKSMVRLMRQANGIGLAANQVGVLKQVAIIEILPDTIKARKWQSGTDYGAIFDRQVPLQVLVNPTITHSSREKSAATEGCLSLPGIEAEVERSVAVKVKAQDVNGTRFRISAKGLYARVIQHEVDHLRGILIINRGRPRQATKRDG